MSAYGSTAAAYGAASRALGTPRSIEHQVFSQITGRIARAQGDKARFPELVAALHENQKLWSLLAADLAGPANALPNDLRGRLFALAEFVRVHTGKVLAREAEADILVDINTSIMRGLRGETGVKGGQ